MNLSRHLTSQQQEQEAQTKMCPQARNEGFNLVLSRLSSVMCDAGLGAVGV